MGFLAESEDPDEMLQNATFHFDLLGLLKTFWDRNTS